jgi:drug/metabolite transporter (DMT)-like permease
MRLSLIQRLLLANRQTRRKASGLPAIWKGMLWMAAGGFLFSILNTIVRAIAMQMDPFEVQFLRYLLGLLVMLPWVLQSRSTQLLANRCQRTVLARRGSHHRHGVVVYCFAQNSFGGYDSH